MVQTVIANGSLPLLAKLSAADRQLADKAMEQTAAQARQAAEAQSAKMARAKEAAGKALRDALGAKNYRSLREALQAEKRALQAALQPPHGLGQDAALLRRAGRKKTDALLRRLGGDKAKLQAIGQKFRAAVEGLAPEPGTKVTPGFHTGGNIATWQGLSPFHKRPQPWSHWPDIDIEPADPHRWFAFQPPFFGFNFKFVPVHNSHFVVDRIHHCDPSAALVGHQVTMDINGDTDDFDYASGQADTQIAFGFVPPVAGLIEVLIDAQCVECRHELRTEDCWGWSDSTTSQTNYLSLQVLHPNTPAPSLAEMSRFSKSTDDDTFTVTQNLILGDHYFAQLRSSGPLPAGQSVVICVGTRSFDISGANDVEIHSKSIFRWFIRSIEVRVLP